eukprot:Gb_13706 [translate_table: standard]
MDDFTVIADTLDEALENLEKTLERCQQSQLALSDEKSKMLVTKGIVLGYYISTKGIEMDPTKIQSILSIPTPHKQRDVRSFLGKVGFYKRFIEKFSLIVAPLNKLLSKDAKFEWTDKCEEAYNELKSRLSTPPILCGPNWTLPFHVHTDASDIGLGAVLGQKDGKLEYATYFISKSLSGAALDYIVIEKEFLAVVFALKKFRHYLGGYQTIVHADHSAIKYLINKPTNNHRIVRWLLLLQEFDVTFVDKPAKENVVVDFWKLMFWKKPREMLQMCWLCILMVLDRNQEQVLVLFSSPPNGRLFPYSFRLEFDYTNNVAKY